MDNSKTKQKITEIIAGVLILISFAGLMVLLLYTIKTVEVQEKQIDIYRERILNLEFQNSKIISLLNYTIQDNSIKYIEMAKLKTEKARLSLNYTQLTEDYFDLMTDHDMLQEEYDRMSMYLMTNYSINHKKDNYLQGYAFKGKYYCIWAKGVDLREQLEVAIHENAHIKGYSHGSEMDMYVQKKIEQNLCEEI